MTILLKNAKIYDGTAAPPFQGDLLLKDDRIARVAPRDTDAATDIIYDLQGKSVAPGFIDSAFAQRLVRHPSKLRCRASNRSSGRALHPFVTGNCGLSAIGFEKETPYTDQIGGGLFGYRGQTTGVYPDAQSLFEAVDGNMPCNIAVLAGHCSARASVAGGENRKLTPEEEQQMLAILEENLKQGAAGISLGLMYSPGLYADEEELKKVAALCVKYDRPLTVHPRAESKVSMAYPQLLGRSHLLRALDELEHIAKGTNLKLQYSHFIFVGRSTFSDRPKAMAIIQRMRREGVQVQFDIYHETKGVSVITVILPAWYQGMSEEERCKPLNRLKLRLLVRASILLLGFDFRDIEIAYIGSGYEEYEGKTVASAGKGAWCQRSGHVPAPLPGVQLSGSGQYGALYHGRDHSRL